MVESSFITYRTRSQGAVIKEPDGCYVRYAFLSNSWATKLPLPNNMVKIVNEDEDIMDVVAKHLVDDWVAIFMESGAEKVRYVSGYAVAVNNKGGRETVSLHSIYPLAATLGTYATEAEY